jgi:peptide/histidine transporter 3/4
LIGAAEVLSSVSSMEFFYGQTPAAFRSIVSSFNLLTTAFGSLLVIPLVYLVNSNPSNQWVTPDLNYGHLDWFFFLLAAMMMFNIAVLLQ